MSSQVSAIRIKGVRILEPNTAYIVCCSCKAHYRTADAAMGHYLVTLPCSNVFEAVMYTSEELCNNPPNTPWKKAAA